MYTMRLFAFFLASLALSALAADEPPKRVTPSTTWRTIASEKGRSIDVDTASVQNYAPGKVLANVRLRMDRELVDSKSGNPYKYIMTQNRYDCESRNAATLKRVFVAATGVVVRDDNMPEAPAMPIRSNMLEERVLRELCRPLGIDVQKKPQEATDESDSDVVIDQQLAEIRAALGKPEQPEDASPKPAAPKVAAPRVATPAPKVATPRVATPAPRVAAPPVSAPRPPAVPKPSVPATASAPKPAAAATPRPAASAPKPAATATPRPATSGAANRARAAVLPPPVLSPARPSAPVEWDYSGPGGPELWGDIAPENRMCKEGKRQSPVDIRDGLEVDLEPVVFEYFPTLFTVADTGRGIEIRTSGDAVSLQGKYYYLERLTFRYPAEERVNGKLFIMGAHLEHRAEDGERLNIAILLERGTPNSTLQTLWDYLPLEKNQMALPDVEIDLSGLLPVERGYYTYVGSMTYPPCEEGVIWVVLQTPVSISAEQEGILARLYPLLARPIQPLEGRRIKSSKRATSYPYAW